MSVRNIRRDANKDLVDLEKENMISEDDQKRAEEKIQELTDKHVKLVDEIVKEKDAEIMTV